MSQQSTAPVLNPLVSGYDDSLAPRVRTGISMIKCIKEPPLLEQIQRNQIVYKCDANKHITVNYESQHPCPSQSDRPYGLGLKA